MGKIIALHFKQMSSNMRILTVADYSLKVYLTTHVQIYI